MKVLFLSQGRMYVVEDGQAVAMPCGAVENYRRNVLEIHKRNEWKTAGMGAAFMGETSGKIAAEDIFAHVSSAAAAGPGRIVYSAIMEDTGGLYTKQPALAIETEGVIIRRNDTLIYDIDYSAAGGRIIASVSDGMGQRHLAMLLDTSTRVDMLTEGESVDAMPSFSLGNPNVIYYSSAGLAIGVHSPMAERGNYGIMRLNLKTGVLDEVLSDTGFNYYWPKENRDGQLYFIRRPVEEKKKKGPTADEVITAPWKVIKAVGGWLNFFTMRYSGETLKKNTGGANPSRFSNKTEKEVFIDGNLVNAEKAIRENEAAGEKNPGIALKTWELVRLAGGEVQVVKAGVLNYTFSGQGDVIFSNGRYIIKLDSRGDETVICKANMAGNILCLDQG